MDYTKQEKNKILEKIKKNEQIIKINEWNAIYHIGKIPKKSGGMRTIYRFAPHSYNDRGIQRFKEASALLQLMPVHECAIAYKKGVNAREKVLKHQNYKFHYKIDFQRFFDSFTLTKTALYWYEKGWTPAQISILYWKGAIRQGHPLSPIVTNVMMVGFDRKLQMFAKNNDGIYSRYADDILISTNKRSDLATVEKFIVNALKEEDLRFIKLNKEKSRQAILGQKLFFIGMSINKQKQGSIGSAKRRELISSLNFYTKRLDTTEEIEAYSRHVSYETDQLVRTMHLVIYHNSINKEHPISLKRLGRIIGKITYSMYYGIHPIDAEHKTKTLKKLIDAYINSNFETVAKLALEKKCRLARVLISEVLEWT